MATVRYELVEHDGGWAYKVDEVFSETFPTHADALAAAEIAAHQHELPGSTETIEFQDSAGNWRQQVASGNDRPRTEVVDDGAVVHAAGHRPARHLPRRAVTPGERGAFGTVLLLAGIGFVIGYLLRPGERR